MNDTDRDILRRRLWEWGDALSGCERRRAEINRLRAQAEDAQTVLGAQVITGMPHASNTGDPTARYVLMRDNAVQRIERLTDEINSIMAAKAEMDDIIRTLPETYQQLLWMRYVRGWTLTIKIPQVLHIADRTAKYWHADALEKIAPYCPFLGID